MIDLDNLMSRIKLNQKELAELVGVSPQCRITIRPKQKLMLLMWERFLRGGYNKIILGEFVGNPPFFNFLSFFPICLSLLGPIHPLNSSGKGKYKSPNALQVD